MAKKKSDFGRVDKVRSVKRLGESGKTSPIAPEREFAPKFSTDEDLFSLENAKKRIDTSQMLRVDPPADPDKEYNENSQYTRYDKSFDVLRVKKGEEVETGDDYLYKDRTPFDAGNNTDVFWYVTKETKTLFFNFLKPVLQIFCPSSIYFDETYTQSNADKIIYTQTQGSRSVLFSDDTPNPTITLVGTCVGGGCSIDDEGRPVLIEAYPDEEPGAIALLTIYTTPTSFFLDTGATQTPAEFNPNDKINTYYFVPISLQTGFEWRKGSMPITWVYPINDRENIYKTEWYRNKIGIYILKKTVFPSERRTFNIRRTTRYRAKTYWNFYGENFKSVPSDPFYFEGPRVLRTLNWKLIQIVNGGQLVELYPRPTKHVFLNDYINHPGVVDSGQGYTLYPLNLNTKEWPDVFYDTGTIGSTQSYLRYEIGGLNLTAVDIFRYSGTVESLQTYEITNLGGMIIG